MWSIWQCFYDNSISCSFLYRPVVIWPDSNSAAAGNHLWVWAWCCKWSPEFNELHDGSATFPHGDLRTTATILWYSCHHLCVVYYCGPHHVLFVCPEGEEETVSQYINHICAWRKDAHSKIESYHAFSREYGTTTAASMTSHFISISSCWSLCLLYVANHSTLSVVNKNRKQHHLLVADGSICHFVKFSENCCALKGSGVFSDLKYNT